VDESLKQYIDELRLKEQKGEPLDAEEEKLLNAFYRDIYRQLEIVTGPTVANGEAKHRPGSSAGARAEAAREKVQRRLANLEQAERDVRDSNHFPFLPMAPARIPSPAEYLLFGVFVVVVFALTSICLLAVS
jgi:hypothetical protein